MDDFQYRDGQLFCEQVNLDELAHRVGTPVYVYSKATLLGHYQRLADAFAALDPIICYSIKSLANIHICRLLCNLGAGMDVVSGGEIFRAVRAEADMSKVFYAGVGKTDSEINLALDHGIGYFNIESEAEFENIAHIAKHRQIKARCALRINPDVDPKTHRKTTTGTKESKFGVDMERARQFFGKYGNDPWCDLTGLHLHIGSPVYSVQPYVKAVKRAMALVDELAEQGITISTLDIGGGFGADYSSGQSPSASDYAKKIVPLLEPFVKAGGQVILEPGRTIAANAGVLLTQVQYIKQGGSKKFVIVDTGMHHLIRPTLYESFHFIWPTHVAPAHEPESRTEQVDAPGLEVCDVVGPICESGDYLAVKRPIPPVARGDLLCVFAAGAYGMVMASNYNAMPRPPEVLIDGNQATLIRRRESYEDLMALEAEPQVV